ncbi:imidazoleglycerol-phosphate dehydratase [Bifidobacterium sp. GSD1FS]|uniref:Imidazoleglycerol-phosphate dehydratase n=1 Tax=Bifidobacterium canis TaxID=2610880 RepID=A0A7K1J297_9BIFI|nr:imidazoleglycerol-phosphate dehydratase [Bifidobacterium canis]
MARTAHIVRQTSESSVDLELNLDGTGQTHIETTVPFFNHMMTALGKHSLIDLNIVASGDTDIDAHHTVEDTAIVFGEALHEALGDKRGIRRFADATVPLDEALAKAVVDVSGRPYCVCSGEPEGFQYAMIGGHFTGSLVRHVMESIAFHAQICLHMHLIAGRDRTISPKPSSRLWHERCVSRSSLIHASPASSPARKARSDGREQQRSSRRIV